MRTWIQILGIAALSAGAALATLEASGPAGFVVYGQVTSTSARTPELTLELQPVDGIGKETVSVDANGSFKCNVSGPGRYMLQITEMQGKVLLDQMVLIQHQGQFLSVALPTPPDADISIQSSVSVSQLRHKIPAKAQKAFDKGQALVRKHKDQEAAKYFREAVSQDPEFADAHNELGASLFTMGQSAEAVDEFKKVVDLVPEHQQALYNMCIALGNLQRWHEAKDVARRELKLEDDVPPIRFILAVSLIMDGGDPVEALDNLQRVSPQIPKAHLVAADFLRQLGRQKEAADQLQQYLKVSRPDDAELGRVKDWLAQLQQ